jgi:DNA ligase-1
MSLLWELPPLYKPNDNKTLYWAIGFNGQALVIRKGQVMGKETVSTRQVVTNLSGRTLEEQALLEARSRYEKKLHSGYITQDVLVTGQRLFQPMLANRYTTIKDGKVIRAKVKLPVAVQVKIDGIRCLAKAKDNDVDLWSRTMHTHVLTAFHLRGIREELKRLFCRLPTNVVIDGELYSPALTFEQIASAVRSHTITEEHECLLYYMFDLIVVDRPEATFAERYDLLRKAMTQANDFQRLVLVSTHVAKTEEEIDTAYKYAVEQGYEGLMLRVIDSPYVQRRCSYILKYKGYMDEEGTVIDVKEASGTEAGLADLVIRNDEGKVFSVRPSGSFEQRRQWMANPALIIGKRYTYRYYDLTSKGIPRFPVGVGIRLDE